MRISKAVRLDKKTRRGIARRAWEGHVYLIPTSGSEGIIVVAGRKQIAPRWEPSADDLTASDWYAIGLNEPSKEALEQF